MHDFTEAMTIEKYLVPAESWGDHLSNMPPRCRQIIESEMAQPSGPTGLALVPDKGYAVLMSGQGPFICWVEWRDCHEAVIPPVSEPVSGPRPW